MNTTQDGNQFGQGSNDNSKKQLSPGRGSNPNIGGDESEYETSTNDEEGYDENISSNDDGYVERRDSEEINRHDDETRYSSPTTRNRPEE